MAIFLWQAYDEQGRPLPNGGVPKLQAVVEGVLHGSSHVWIWRNTGTGIEILVQHRASGKINWPGLYDKSAGGHIAYNEQPVDAVVRKARDELGLRITATQLKLTGVRRWRSRVDGAGLVENEFQWIFLAELANPHVRLPTAEVDGAEWRSIASFENDVCANRSPHYVPYGKLYFATLCSGIMHTASQSPSRA